MDEDFSLGRTIKYGVITLLLVFGCAVIAIWLNFGAKWITQPAKLADADRVQTVYTQYVNDKRALDGLKVTATGLRTQLDDLEKTHASDDRATWTYNDRQSYESLSRDYRGTIAAYNSKCAAYMADWDNDYKSMVTRFSPDLIPGQCSYLSP